MTNKRDEQVEKIADLFYQAILDGTAPWTKEWKAADFRQLAHNPVSEKAYSGMNSLLLDTIKIAKGYESNGWLTFKQAKDLDGNIKKGEKGTQISFFSMVEVEDKNNGDEKEYRPLLKYYTVFSLDQTENINQEKLKILYEKNSYEKENFISNEDCQKVLANLDIRLEHKAQERAYYSPSNDLIVLPLKEQFKSSGGYYSTAFHEIGHATGHKSRLDRDLSGKFGTQSYAKEELRAEIYSFLQAKDLGMDFNLENHQSYVNSWVSLFKDKKTEIVEAVKDSFKMLDFVKENYINKSLQSEDNKLQTFSDKYDLDLDERTVLKELIKGFDKNDNSALEQIRKEMNSTQVKEEAAQVKNNIRRNK